MGRRGNRDNDGKYLRLTGLWPSKKKDTLWTGKIRNQDIGTLQDKIQEADDAGADLVVFLWENTNKKGKRDPEFTVQISVSEDDGNGRGSSSRGRGRDRDRDEERDNDQDKDDTNTNEDNNEESEEKEEKPSRRSKASNRNTSKDKEESSSRRSTGKKDKNDW